MIWKNIRREKVCGTVHSLKWGRKWGLLVSWEGRLAPLRQGTPSANCGGRDWGTQCSRRRELSWLAGRKWRLGSQCLQEILLRRQRLRGREEQRRFLLCAFRRYLWQKRMKINLSQFYIVLLDTLPRRRADNTNLLQLSEVHQSIICRELQEAFLIKIRFLNLSFSLLKWGTCVLNFALLIWECHGKEDIRFRDERNGVEAPSSGHVVLSVFSLLPAVVRSQW